MHDRVSSGRVGTLRTSGIILQGGTHHVALHDNKTRQWRVERGKKTTTFRSSSATIHFSVIHCNLVQSAKNYSSSTAGKMKEHHLQPRPQNCSDGAENRNRPRQRRSPSSRPPGRWAQVALPGGWDDCPFPALGLGLLPLLSHTGSYSDSRHRSLWNRFLGIKWREQRGAGQTRCLPPVVECSTARLGFNPDSSNTS